MKQDKVLVTCPRCGHKQREPRLAYSTVCKECQQHFRVQEVLHPAPPPKELPRDVRRIHCFKCAGELSVVASAQSTMCKFCGSHVDLHDYRITNTIAKNIRTKGRLVIEEQGFLLNTDSIGGEVIIKGRLIGKLAAEKSLEIRSSAEIKGTIQPARLIIPAGNLFRWPETLAVGAAEIAGELVADLRAEGTVVLKSTARLFGQIRARDLAVESGAVFVGAATIGT